MPLTMTMVPHCHFHAQAAMQGSEDSLTSFRYLKGALCGHATCYGCQVRCRSMPYPSRSYRHLEKDSKI